MARPCEMREGGTGCEQVCCFSILAFTRTHPLLGSEAVLSFRSLFV